MCYYCPPDDDPRYPDPDEQGSTCQVCGVDTDESYYCDGCKAAEDDYMRDIRYEQERGRVESEKGDESNGHD